MMKQQVEKVIKEYGMLSRDDRCIAAVSGGADSTALLLVLSKLRDKIGFDLRAVHIHHGIRGQEADRDAGFVENLCKDLNVPCKIIYVDAPAYAKDNKLSLEEAGRILRYQKLNEAVDDWCNETSSEDANVRIAVAHNLEDNAETILMQLARGSGLKGLSGISPLRDRIIRPLINVSRREIENYLRSEGQDWVTDSTNNEDEYTRNRIRHNILPELIDGVNEGAVENIARAGRFAGMADEYLSETAAELLKKALIEVKGGYGVLLKAFIDQPLIIRTYIVRAVMEHLNSPMKDITFTHLEDIARLADAETGKHINLPYGLMARRGYEALELFHRDVRDKRDSELKGTDSFTAKSRIRKFAYNGEDIPELQYTKWFDYDKIEGQYEIRTRRPGDYIELKGVGRKSLNAFMTDIKIPSDERDGVPLVADGSHVMWLVGHRISEAFKVDNNTTTVLEINYRGDDDERED